jgi:hypothetical protein
MTVRPLPVPARFSFVYVPPSVEDAVALLRTGRAHEALSVLYRLPDRIEVERQATLAAAEAAHRVALRETQAAHRAALAEANARMAELRREVERLNRELARPPHKNPRQLAAALADGRTTPLRVAELLKVRPADVARIAEGRVGLSSAAWQRVLTEIAA